MARPVLRTKYIRTAVVGRLRSLGSVCFMRHPGGTDRTGLFIQLVLSRIRTLGRIRVHSRIEVPPKRFIDVGDCVRAVLGRRAVAHHLDRSSRDRRDHGATRSLSAVGDAVAHLHDDCRPGAEPGVVSRKQNCITDEFCYHSGQKPYDPSR